MPRAPFHLRLGFRIPEQAPALRETDLVRLVVSGSKATVGPTIKLLSGMRVASSGGYMGRLAAIEMQPKPVVDGHAIQPDLWHELLLTVDPIRGQFTAAGLVHGQTPPALDAPPPGTKGDGRPTPQWIPLFGGGPRKFFAMADPPCEVALQIGSEGAYRPAVVPLELAVGPSIVLPKHDAQRPWANPALLADMTWRDNRLEILCAHAGASLVRVEPTSGAWAFVEKMFGPNPGQALAWDAARSCYWWVEPKAPHHLQARRSAETVPAGSSPTTVTASAPAEKQGESPQPIILHPHGRLSATATDLFYVSGSQSIYRWQGKSGRLAEFDYREAFDKKFRYAGVAADEHTVLFAGPYEAVNAAYVMAVDLVSGRPIRRFSLRHAAGGITAMTRARRRLYVLAANDRLILDAPWPEDEALGLTQPVMQVSGVKARPLLARESVSLLPADPELKRAWKGDLKQQQGKSPNDTVYAFGNATLSLPEPTLVVGNTLGECRYLELRPADLPPGRALHLTLHPSPVGKPHGVYVAATESARSKAATQPDRPVRTDAETFFTTDVFVADAKSPLRKHKPDQDDAPTFVLAAHQSTTLVLDLIADLGLRPGTWIGQVRLTGIGQRIELHGVTARAADDVVRGAMTGAMFGRVLDFGEGVHRLDHAKIELAPQGRRGDRVTLKLRTAANRTALPYAAWQDITSTPLTTFATSPSTTSGIAASADGVPVLQRFVQWRLDLASPHACEPPVLSGVELHVARRPIPRQAAVAPKPYQQWRTWWPVIFAVPAACVLVWFAFLRRSRDDEASSRRRG